MNKIFIRCSVAVIVGTMFNSCTGDFEDLNKKPDALVAANINASMMGQMFAQSQYNAMYGPASPFQIAQSLFADLYCEYFATTQVNFDSDRHTQVGGWSESAWNSFYNAAAPQIKFVEDFT